jgi:hypothetical protein
LYELGLQREIGHNGDYCFSGAVTLLFGTDDYAKALPSRERRDDRCSYTNPCPKALRYLVAKGR